MKCDRCRDAERPVEEMLRLTVHPIPAAGLDAAGNDTQELFLCPRCSVFILSLLGASKHVISVQDPSRDRWMSDAVGVNKSELQYVAMRLFLDTEKMPDEDGGT